LIGFQIQNSKFKIWDVVNCQSSILNRHIIKLINYHINQNVFSIKKRIQYSLVVPTSMGVRITPVDAQPVQSTNMFRMQATSAETNVASISSYLGLPVKVLTTFVKDSPIAAFIKADLRARNMEYEGPEVPQGDPWGYRHQFNIADSGFGLRGPRVQNDRQVKWEKTLNVKDFDLERIFGKEGVQVVHLSALLRHFLLTQATSVSK
jgi:2-dehydro-3-deoxygluconokinase